MFGLTQTTPTNLLGGTLQSTMAPGSSASPLYGPIEGFKPSGKSTFGTSSFGQFTDAGDDQNLYDRSRVSMPVPAHVSPGVKDFLLPAGAMLFVWGSKNVIDRSKRETYDVMGISGLNSMILDFQYQGYSTIEAMAFGKPRPVMPIHSVVRELDRDKSSNIGAKMTSFFMDLHSIARMINLLGPPFANVSKGTAAAFKILKSTGGCLFNVVHEGTADMGNIWDDVLPSAKVHYILTKKNMIDITNPFNPRPFMVLPITSATSCGEGAYILHGIKPTNEAATAKRSRLSTDSMITKKRVVGEIRDNFDELGFITFSHSYDRFCMALNPELYEMSTVTGTIASVRNHEKRVVRGKESDIIASHMTPSFLDWRWSKFGPEYVVNPKTNKAVYSSVLWNISRQDGCVFRGGIVISGLRGKMPQQDDLKAHLLTDHENGMIATCTIATKSKLRMHISIQQ